MRKEDSSTSRKPLVGFIKWWILITGLYSAAAVCPFCGQAGCPAGAGSAGVVGGCLAFIMPYGKGVCRYLKQVFFKRRE